MIKSVFRYSLFFLIVGFFCQYSYGQEAMEKFGKNRVQYKNFKWRYYSTENFDIFFYDGGNEIARIAVDFLEKDFDRITDILGTVSYSKTEIFLYNSATDLLQSNIGVNDNSFDVAGQTDFVKALVEIAYPGNAEEFKKVLIHKVASMLIYDMMFGGSLSDMFQNSYMLLLPEWFMSGAARYTAYGWDVEMDDYIRDLLRNKKIKNLNRFTSEEAALVGQSLWNFVAERYGVSYISNILNLTRIIRNEERSISGTIGVPFKAFLAEYKNYYMQQTSFVDQNYILPNASEQIPSKKQAYNMKDFKISPDGNYYTYSFNDEGKYKVMLGRMDKKKEKKILSGGYKLINQEPEKNLPLISWKDENTLGIISTRFGRNFLTIYDVNSNRKIKKELTRINQIKDFDIVRNGNLAVISADRNGDNDLYLISLRRNSIKKITSDFYDDINPRFVPGTSSIVFSSNRPTDTLDTKGRPVKNITDTYNIFIYNIDSTKNRAYRVTNALSKNVNPIAVNGNEIYYLSDQQGIFNLYKYNLDDKINFQVSNYGTGIKDFDISYDKKYFGYVMPDRGEDKIYLQTDFELDRNIFTAQTKRQQYLNAKFVAQRLREARKKKTITDAGNLAPQEKIKKLDDKGEPVPEPVVKRPSFLDQFENRNEFKGQGSIDIKNYTFTAPAPIASTQETPDKAEDEENDEILDTSGYVFDTDVVKKGKSTGSFLSNYRRLKKESDVAGPFPYESKFSADNIVTSFVIDPLMGFGIKLETQMNDQLENHKFYGGIMIPTDLKSGSFYGEYRYLKHTIDFHARYDRTSLFRNVDRSNNQQRYIKNTYEIGASLPFNSKTRLSVVPFLETTRFWDLAPQSVQNPPNGPVTSSVQYAGIKTELIFDNSSVVGMNVLQGTRGKIGIRHNEGISDSQKSFTNFYMDLRHYQKISREIVFATRLFYGRFWGPNPQQYLLGGMDNWLFNSTERSEGDPLNHEDGVDNSNILFVEYVTSLRGFDYNTFYGENTLLFNAELRIPLIKYLKRGPISSNFLRNLQFIGFYDIGSAWTGNSPFATENSVNTEIIDPEGSPFKAKIQNFKNPWLSSYGFGVRTVLLGYYVKLDIAYPMEDYVVKDPKFFVTLGYDF